MKRGDSLVAILSARAEHNADRVALTFVDHLGAELERRTYRELDIRARAIAAALQDRRVAGPCLLLYPPGLEFIAAFFGCQYAGVPAVPVFPPDPTKPQQLQRLLAIADEARPAVALTTQALLPVVKTAVRGAVRPVRRADLAGQRRAGRCAPRSLAAHRRARQRHRLPPVHLGLDRVAARRDGQPRQPARQPRVDRQRRRAIIATAARSAGCRRTTTWA